MVGPVTSTDLPGEVLEAQGISLGVCPVESVKLRSAILVGMEYILLENKSRITKIAEMLALIGAPAVKPFAEHIEWGEMLSSPESEIDFTRIDNFVAEFQNAGFAEIVEALKSHNNLC